MRKTVFLMILSVFALVLLGVGVSAEAEEIPTGWAPSAIANVSAFYLNGNYKLLAGGFGAGAAYTFRQGPNVNSAAIYLGPQSSQSNGQTTTSLAVIAYLDLFKTSTGQFGVGLGTETWKSGVGFRAPDRNNTFMAFAYKF